MEIELLVGEMGEDPEGDQLFHLLYDGTVMDTRTFVVIGGEADVIRTRLEDEWEVGMALPDVVSLAVHSLGGDERTLVPDDLEVAVLSRNNGRRSFQRIEGENLSEILS